MLLSAVTLWEMEWNGGLEGSELPLTVPVFSYRDNQLTNNVMETSD